MTGCPAPVLKPSLYKEGGEGLFVHGIDGQVIETVLPVMVGRWKRTWCTPPESLLFLHKSLPRLLQVL